MIDWVEWYEGMPLPNPDALVEVEYQDSAVRESKLAADVDWRAQGATAVTRYRVRMPGSLADARQEAGTHYLDMAVQPWAVMQGCMPPDQQFGFMRGNVLKYAMRAGKKGSALDDMRKCAHYAQKAVEVLEAQQ